MAQWSTRGHSFRLRNRIEIQIKSRPSAPREHQDAVYRWCDARGPIESVRWESFPTTIGDTFPVYKPRHWASGHVTDFVRRSWESTKTQFMKAVMQRTYPKWTVVISIKWKYSVLRRTLRRRLQAVGRRGPILSEQCDSPRYTSNRANKLTNRDVQQESLANMDGRDRHNKPACSLKILMTQRARAIPWTSQDDREGVNAQFFPEGNQ
jgi:hypothetical protein